MSRLEKYRAKRKASRTPEPFGGAAAPGGSRFVVQQHAARNLHYDLRLEIGGTLVSWAVPKGPSPNPADKRLAMKVEDHPVEYVDFEGVIPAGEYGAGPVIVWDQGTWVAKADPEAGLEQGKLLFELRGYKLRGVWTLVKTRQAENSWLLIKERDDQVDETGTEVYPEESIYSGLTVGERRDPGPARAAIGAALEDAGASRRAVDPRKLSPMLAVAEAEPFSRAGWVFEIKLDGYRLIAARHQGEALLLSRNGNDLTATFPEIARAVRGLPYEGVVLDGEVVVHDGRGLPSFQELQKRGRLTRWADVQRAAVERPATFYAFDLLAAEGFDARELPLLERKAVLRELLPRVGPIRFSDHLEERGEAVYEQVTALGLEGVVGKKADSPYRTGLRSRDWLKVRALRTDDFVVVGWTPPGGSRAGFGSLHLAQHDAGGALVYAGAVGTGFGAGQLADLSARLARIEVDEPPCGGPLPPGRGHHWTRPELVVEVRYKEVTDDGLLRHPSFLRERDDKEPAECVQEGVHPPEVIEPAAVAPPAAPAREIPFTNLDKILYPDAGYTKGDVIEYYRAVAEWMLPYLRDRPLVLTRYPDGIDGKSFYQKNAPEWAPEWVRTVTVWSEGSERDLDYFVVEDVDSLLYVANSAALLLHVWSSRVSSLGNPDWCILDLDPKEAPFEHVVELARTLHRLCDEIGLPAFVKTSGSTGLHVLVPLGRKVMYDQSRALGELLARVTVRERRDIATIERVVRKRGGKVYVDFLQNGHGKLLVAPYSTRPIPGAPVSAPLRWKEVGPSLDIGRFTIASMPRRLRAMKDDPLRPVLDLEPDLAGAIARLAERMGVEE
ncbi:MAG TPA: DNA ligase D [Gemmatimonadota bacterium]|nr:DNA ligase D [Gemmatimonadota bacterium]